MKRTFLMACAAWAACTTAGAQSVTIYGIVDAAVEHLTNVNAAGASLSRMPNLTGTAPSRLGFRGAEDLGGGLQAIFNLEMGLALDTGGLNNGGRTWGRAASVGLSSPWGRVTVGRQANMTPLALMSDVLGPALYSLASLDFYFPNAINDNSLAYVARFSGITAGATYSLGRDTASLGGPAATNCPGEVAGDSKQCRQWTAVIKYDTPAYGAALSMDRMNGGPTAAFGLNNPAFTDTRQLISAWGKWAGVTVSAGLIHRTRQTATEFKSDLAYLGVSYAVTPANLLDAEVARLDVKDSSNDSTMLVIRARHFLAKRTSVYAMLGHMTNKGVAANSLSAGATVGAGMDQAGLAAGLRHDF